MAAADNQTLADYVSRNLRLKGFDHIESFDDLRRHIRTTLRHHYFADDRDAEIARLVATDLDPRS